MLQNFDRSNKTSLVVYCETWCVPEAQTGLWTQLVIDGQRLPNFIIDRGLPTSLSARGP